MTDSRTLVDKQINKSDDHTKIKPRVDYEPRSAHGRAVKKKKIKPRVDYEPRSAHDRAVKKKKKKSPCKEPRSAHGRAVNYNFFFYKNIFVALFCVYGDD